MESTMQLKIRMSKQKFLGAVLADDLVNEDALTLAEENGILTIDADAEEIEACMGELRNCYSKAELKQMIC